jgi:hypothetical protein
LNTTDKWEIFAKNGSFGTAREGDNLLSTGEKRKKSRAPSREDASFGHA